MLEHGFIVLEYGYKMLEHGFKVLEYGYKMLEHSCEKWNMVPSNGKGLRKIGT